MAQFTHPFDFRETMLNQEMKAANSFTQVVEHYEPEEIETKYKVAAFEVGQPLSPHYYRSYYDQRPVLRGNRRTFDERMQATGQKLISGQRVDYYDQEALIRDAPSEQHLSISGTANSKFLKLTDHQAPHRVTFFNFFVVQDGVISFSLRDLTIICTAIISLSFLAMLYGACSQEQLVCSFTWGNLQIPMISDVVALPIYDRIFILLNTVYFMGVHQVNVRAFYKRLSDAGVSEGLNDFMFYCGIISCISIRYCLKLCKYDYMVQFISLPLIGVFDCHNFKPLHYLFAGLFFLTAGTYLFAIADQMHKNKASFPPQDEKAINLNRKLSFIRKFKLNGIILQCASYLEFTVQICWIFIMIGLTGMLILSMGIMGSGYWVTPVLEWTAVFLNMNYFGLINFTNPFYDSIHPYGNQPFLNFPFLKVLRL